MTFLLTKIFLKSSIQKMNDKYSISDSKSKHKTKVILYGLLILYLFFVIGIFCVGLINSLKEIKQETIFIGLILLLNLGVVTVQTVFSSINLLYFAKDTDSVLPLPIKPYQIILARTNVLILVEYAIEAIVGLIPLIIYGVIVNCEILFYIKVIFVLILLPILPILLISLLVMIIMSFSKITKNKNAFQMVSTILVLIAVIAFSIGVSNLETNTMTDEQMLQTITQANSMVNMIKGYFPTLDYSIEAITSTNTITCILSFAKILGITIISFIIYILLSQKLYFKGLVGSLYSSSGKRKNKEINIKNKKSSLAAKYIGKEFKILYRNPVFLMQCLLPAVLFPILCIVLFLFGMDVETSAELANLSNSLETLKPLIMFVILGITQFFSMIIYISVTAISRDGENAVFMRYIPVKLFDQFVYKTIPNIIMIIISNIIVFAIAKYFINLSIMDLIVLFIVSTIMGVFHSFALLLVDLKRPKLNWSSEYAVVKQNLNLIFPMIFAFLHILVIVAVAMVFDNVNIYISFAIIGVIYLIANWILLRYLNKKQYKLLTF